MKSQTPMEPLICESLQQVSQEVDATTQLKERIDAQLIQLQKKENSSMKKITLKKLIVLAAAVCVLGSTVAYAAGKIAGISSSSSHKNDVTDFARLPEAQKSLGVPIQAVESFKNGFQFTVWNVGERTRQDEQNNVLGANKFLTMVYKNAANADLFLSVDPADSIQANDQKPASTLDYNGVTLEYSTVINKMVPPDYELTEEDKINSQKEGYYISYGSSEVEVLVVQNVSWIFEGAYYSLMDMNQSVDEQGLLDMAKEMLDAK